MEKDKDFLEVIQTSQRALGTSKAEWHAYPYEREVPPHHIRIQQSIDDMIAAYEDGVTVRAYMNKRILNR
jgi:hypothetical protein